MDFDQENQKRWKAFHKTLDPFPHSFQLENQEQLTVVTCKKVMHTVQSDFNVGLTTPLERARALNLMCFLHCRLGDRREALKRVQQALNEEGQNKNIVSLANMAVVLWFRDLHLRTTKQVEELKQLLNDDEFEYLAVCAKAELAYTYTRLGGCHFLVKAIALFSEVITKARESEVCLWTFGLALAERRMLYQRSLPILSDTSGDARRFAVLGMYLETIEMCQCDKLRAKVYVEVAHLIDNRWGSELQEQMEAEAKLSRIEACDKAIELDSNDPSVLWKSGKIFRHAYQLQKSYDLIKKSAALKPTSVAFHQLGLTCIQLAKQSRKPWVGRRTGESGRGQSGRARGRARIRGRAIWPGRRAGYPGGSSDNDQAGDGDDQSGSGGRRGRGNGGRKRGDGRNDGWGGDDGGRDLRERTRRYSDRGENKGNGRGGRGGRRGGGGGAGRGGGKWREGWNENQEKDPGTFAANQPREKFCQYPLGRQENWKRGTSEDSARQSRGGRAGADRGRGGRHPSNVGGHRWTPRRGLNHAAENSTSYYSLSRNKDKESPEFAFVFDDNNSQTHDTYSFSQAYRTSGSYDEAHTPGAFNQAYYPLNGNNSQRCIPGVCDQEFSPGTCVYVSAPATCHNRFSPGVLRQSSSSSGISSQTSSPEGCNQESALNISSQVSALNIGGQESTQGISERSPSDICSEQYSPGNCNERSAPDTCNQQSPSYISRGPAISHDQQGGTYMYSRQSTPGSCSQQFAPEIRGSPTNRNDQQRDPKTFGEDFGACGGSSEDTDLKRKAKHTNPMQQENDDSYTSYDSGFETGRWEDDFSRLSLSDDIPPSVNRQSPITAGQRHLDGSYISLYSAEVRGSQLCTERSSINVQTTPTNSVKVQNSPPPEALSSSANTLSQNAPVNSLGAPYNLSSAPVNSSGVSSSLRFASINVHDTPVSITGAEFNSAYASVNSSGAPDICSRAPLNSQGASISTRSAVVSFQNAPVNTMGAVNSQYAPVNTENAPVNSEYKPAILQAPNDESMSRSRPTRVFQGLETPRTTQSAIGPQRVRRGAQPATHRQRSYDEDTPSRRDINVFRGSCKTGRVMRFCETDDYVGEAIEALEKAVEISESQNAHAMTDLGQMYHAVGRLDEALKLFEDIINVPDYVCGCFNKISAYEQAGLILRDMSRRDNCSDEEEQKQLVEESEGKLSMALQLCSRLARRTRGLGPFIPHVIRSFSELLRSAKSSSRAPAEKNRMIARLFQLIENHKESLKVLSQLLSQDRDQEKNPETLKIMIENFIGLGQYDAALQVIGVVRALDERPDRELFEDDRLFVRVNMQAGREELLAAAASDGFAPSTITRPTAAGSTGSRAGFYFSAAFREQAAEIEWEMSSSEDSGSSAGASDDEDEGNERWDVMVLHPENAEREARDCARALTEACGLKVTVNEDDCAAGSPITDAILWVMARCRQVVVVLSTGGDRRGKSCKDSRSETSSGKKSGRARSRRGRRSGAAVSATFGVLLQHAAKRCNTVVLAVEEEGGSPSGQAVPEILGPLRRRQCPPQLLRRGRSNVCGGGGGNDDVGNRGGGCGGGDVSAVGFVSDVNHGAGDGVAGAEGNNGSGFFGSADNGATERSFDDCVGGAVGGRVDPEPSTVGSGRGSRHAVGNDGGEEVVNLSDPVVQQAIFDLFSFLVDVKFEQEL